VRLRDPRWNRWAEGQRYLILGELPPLKWTRENVERLRRLEISEKAVQIRSRRRCRIYSVESAADPD
jgi:hypothetical protein